MLYFRCPTCKMVLANKQLLFEKKMEEICQSDMTDEEKEEEKMQLPRELGVKKMCCRMRLLTYVPLITTIK